jgi:hypothetical protein
LKEEKKRLIKKENKFYLFGKRGERERRVYQLINLLNK